MKSEELQSLITLVNEKEGKSIISTKNAIYTDEQLKNIKNKLIDLNIDDLNTFVSETSLSHFFRGCGTKAQEILFVLGGEICKDLNIRNRARVIDAAVGAVDWGDSVEACVCDILLQSHGAELTLLKNAIDAGGTFRTLQQLVFTAITNSERRQSLLSHFRNEAEKSGPVSRRKVLSDIDDTLFANWSDERYPRGTVYPGVLEFLRQISRTNNENNGNISGLLNPSDEVGNTIDSGEGDVTFITARPQGFRGTLLASTYNKLVKVGAPEDLTILPGTTRAIVGTNKDIAERKYENFKQFRELYPEYRFVFIGDSGQGDLMLLECMLEHHSDVVLGGFIHDVTAVPLPPDERAKYRQRKIYFADTYVGFAALALENNILAPNGAAAVARAAIAEFSDVVFTDVTQMAARVKEFDVDLRAVARRLPLTLSYEFQDPTMVLARCVRKPTNPTVISVHKINSTITGLGALFYTLSFLAYWDIMVVILLHKQMSYYLLSSIGTALLMIYFGWCVLSDIWIFRRIYTRYMTPALRHMIRLWLLYWVVQNIPYRADQTCDLLLQHCFYFILIHDLSHSIGFSLHYEGKRFKLFQIILYMFNSFYRLFVYTYILYHFYHQYSFISKLMTYSTGMILELSQVLARWQSFNEQFISRHRVKKARSFAERLSKTNLQEKFHQIKKTMSEKQPISRLRRTMSFHQLSHHHHHQNVTTNNDE